MRKLYIEFPSVQALPGQISWTSLCEILLIDDKNKRDFYLQKSVEGNWSSRELINQKKRMLYERSLPSKSTEIQKNIISQIVQYNPQSIVKDPYMLDFLGIPENGHLEEHELENRLILHLEKFLLELGNGFMFVGRQKRITINNTHYYVDLVFYKKNSAQLCAY